MDQVLVSMDACPSSAPDRGGPVGPLGHRSLTIEVTADDYSREASPDASDQDQPEKAREFAWVSPELYRRDFCLLRKDFNLLQQSAKPLRESWQQ